MTADRLYYVNQYQTEIDAIVLSCKQVKNGWLVELDQTLFYPTGGGQPCDLGTIGEVQVLDVFEKDEHVYITCAEPIPVGEKVHCKIDWQRRFMLMQQHSGEHIVSGIIHARFGYDNVGFHMGSDTITIDFSGEISYEQMQEIEAAANEVIYQNLACTVLYPDEQTLANLSYRSKKELSGQVRLVHFNHIDLCACCGLHVKQAGEIGLIKLLSTTKFRSGSRIEMLCGQRALQYMNTIFEQNRSISALLSAKPFATAAAAQRISEELKNAQYRCTCLENELFARIASEKANAGNVLIFEKNLTPDALRRLCDAVLHTCSGICAVFSEKEGGYHYAIGALDGDLRELVRSLNAQLQGRGGGKPTFAQGSVAADRTSIEAFFVPYLER
ncbi:MAG: alanyl-tRNA editing protein [Ruminococcaceae bacterium]|nr:alanyl-tRNA editing protein [Oscillospiraceae bacterium]